MASLARQDGVGVIGKDNGYFVLVSHGAERSDVAIQGRTTWIASPARKDGRLTWIASLVTRQDGVSVFASHGAERNDVAIQSRTTWMASPARQDGVGVIGTDDGISSLRASRVRRVKRGNPE